MYESMWFLIGMLFWQFCITVALIIHGDSENRIIPFGGIPMLLALGTIKAVRFLRALYINKTHRSYGVYQEEKILPVAILRVRKGDEKNYYQKGEHRFYIEPHSWKPSDCIWSIKRIRSNSWFNQIWVDKNVLKHEEDDNVE